jgi:FixJ family two-component response regulator
MPSTITRAASTDGTVPIVHVVEDDGPTRNATARFLRAAGYLVRTYATATEFLGEAPPGVPGCVVLDLQLPGMSGFDVQDALARAKDPLPIVFLSGHGKVPDSVQAMKRGAVDFLTKSADGSDLLDAVHRALARDGQDRAHRARQRELRARYQRLSTREREVLAHLISGQLNKQVGFDLGISEQTTKIHRHRVLEKMQADSIAHLVRLAAELGIAPVGRIR